MNCNCYYNCTVGLRDVISVRIMHTKALSDGAVLYVLRVEDVESGLEWTSMKRYRDFFSLHQELSAMSHHILAVPFPRKKIVRLHSAVVEERIVALESFIRIALNNLTVHSAADFNASKALRHMQNFFGPSRLNK